MHDWKSCVRHKRTEGSNPSLSAREIINQQESKLKAGSQTANDLWTPPDPEGSNGSNNFGCLVYPATFLQLSDDNLKKGGWQKKLRRSR